MHTCKSSTLAVCPTNGLGSIFHAESDDGSHRWIKFLQSPRKRQTGKLHPSDIVIVQDTLIG